MTVYHRLWQLLVGVGWVYVVMVTTFPVVLGIGCGLILMSPSPPHPPPHPPTQESVDFIALCKALEGLKAVVQLIGIILKAMFPFLNDRAAT